jgi:hypothetical protein
MQNTIAALFYKYGFYPFFICLFHVLQKSLKTYPKSVQGIEEVFNLNEQVPGLREQLI